MKPQPEISLGPPVPIAYLVSRYPGISHTFIQREVLELRGHGWDIRTFTVRCPDDQSVLTDVDRKEHARTTAILPTSSWRLVGAHLSALRRSHRAYWRTLVYALASGDKDPRRVLWQLFYFGEAMILWRVLARAGLRHIHAHFANVACDIARLVARYGNECGEKWSWSFTMHGSTEFFDVQRYGLAGKVASANFVVCVSDFTRSQLMALVTEDQWAKLSVVHCGIDVRRFLPQSSREPRSGALRILTLGRLHPVKLQAELLDAVAILQRQGVDAELTILGDGEMRVHLERKILDLGLKNRVRIPGAVSQDDVHDHLEWAEAFCLPSAAEGVPVSVMEAMAAELPCVVSRITGVPELIDDGVSGLLITPGRSDVLAEALGRLAQDPQLRTSLGQQARRKVSDEFEITQCVDELTQTFARYLLPPRPQV